MKLRVVNYVVFPSDIYNIYIIYIYNIYIYIIYIIVCMYVCIVGCGLAQTMYVVKKTGNVPS